MTMTPTIHENANSRPAIATAARLSNNRVVLGAGIGWARSITFHPELAARFQDFFARGDTFGLQEIGDEVVIGLDLLALRQLSGGDARLDRADRRGDRRAVGGAGAQLGFRLVLLGFGGRLAKAGPLIRVFQVAIRAQHTFTPPAAR